jgi:hypothetical protein
VALQRRPVPRSEINPHACSTLWAQPETDQPGGKLTAEIAFGCRLHYDFRVHETSKIILCDGCGQPAGPEHIARRLKRLESMTRYRPIHVQALFLGAASPLDDEDYLYSAEGSFRGEGATLLAALGVELAGRSVEEILSDFQRRGYLLAHLIECGEKTGDATVRREVLARRIPATLTRIRRSFKPKRLVLLGEELAEFVPQFMAANLDATLILRDGKPFEWNEIDDGLLAKELAAPLQAL